MIRAIAYLAWVTWMVRPPRVKALPRAEQERWLAEIMAESLRAAREGHRL